MNKKSTTGLPKSNSSLFVSDLDGTLLDGRAELSERTRAGIQTVLDADVPFTIATARSVQSAQQIFDGIELKLPIITFSGGFISNLSDGSFEYVLAIEPSILDSILDMGRFEGLVPFVSSNDGDRDNLYFMEPENDGMKHYLDERRAMSDSRLRRAREFADYHAESVVCITYISRCERVAALSERILSSGVAVTTSLFENPYANGWYWLTIRHPKARKGRATRELMSRHGLESHELVAFGDQIDDMELLGTADRGVAVENGVRELRQSADEIIGSNQSDAVILYIMDAAALRG